MTVVSYLANNDVEIYEASDQVFSETMHPLVLTIKVYSDNKLIFKKSRKNRWFYKHFVFPTSKIQDEIKRLQEERMQNAIQQS